MRMKREYTDEPIDVACKDVSSCLNGRIIIRDEDLRLTLFSFDGELVLKHEQRRVLRLQDSEYATLLDCVESGGSEGVYGLTDRPAYLGPFRMRGPLLPGQRRTPI
jgi:hypothetical protein